MAKLARLRISGIRNFAPSEEDAQQLTFAPLTLVVGPNGCGKSTIVEAVNYICCGELQGAKKDFVNDPKLSSAASSKGRIKLTVVDSRGNEITAFKNVEVEIRSDRKGGKFKSKPVELVTRSPAGDISTTLDDHTNKFCRIMDVSPTVLNNVIFCHQENATWPLAEANKLKEKFDEIFETEKYKKRLEKITTEKESQEYRLYNLLKPQLGEAEEKKKHVQKQTKILEEKTKRIETLQNDIKIKNEELVPVKNQLNEIRRLEEVIQNLERQILVKQATIDRVVQEQKDVAKSIETEFQGSDEELEDQIKLLELDRHKEERLIKNLESIKAAADVEIEQIRASIEEAQLELGALTQEQTNYLKKCAQRQKVIKETLGEDIQSDNHKAKAALKKLKSILVSRQKCLGTLKENKEKLQEEWQEVIDKARETKSIAKNNIKNKEAQVEENKKRQEEIFEELEKFKNIDADLQKCEKRMEETDARIARTNNYLTETEESTRKSNYDKLIEDNQLLLNRLKKEKNMFQNKEIIRKKIENENIFIKRKQEEWRTFKERYAEDLKQLFPAEETARNNLTEALLEKQKTAEASIRALSGTVNTIEKEISTLEVLRRSQKEEITKSEKQLEHKEKLISSVCDNNEDFNEIFENTLQKRENLLWEKGVCGAMQTILEEYIKEFEQKEHCPVCETSFSREIAAKIVAKLRNESNKLPQKFIYIEEELKKEEIFYNKLQSLKTVNEEVDLLKSEIPLLNLQLDEIDQNLEKESAELAELKLKLEEPEKIVEICRNIMTKIAALEPNFADIEKSKKVVENLETELSQIVLNKTKEEIEAEISSASSKIEEIERSKEEAATKINSYTDKLLRLKQLRTGLAENRTEYLQSVKGKSHYEKLAAEVGDKLARLQEEIAGFEQTICSSDEELKNAVENKKKEMTNYENQIKTVRKKIESRETVIENLRRQQDEIDDYLQNRIEENITDIKSKLQHHRTQIKEQEEIKSETINKISDKTNQLLGQKQKFRELEDNVILRSKRVEEAALEVEIGKLRHETEEYISKTSCEENWNLRYQSEILEKKINFLEGEMNQVSIDIKELKDDLQKPEYKDALTNFRHKYYEVKIAESIVDDLSKYIEAFKSAIFEYPQTKLAQINQSLKELWRSIYRGNDIDYIEIQPVFPEDNAKKGCTYKVVQVKHGVELEMRKRCSVGQKNLACLIIRMALAEALSSNCGILALDEPTTSLDRENIQSLCETLSLIMNHKKKDDNFQLLIISHDEEFVNKLILEQNVSYYYRITRDENGFSKIKQEYFRS